MKKFEYKVISPRNEIQKIRESETPRKEHGDEVLLIEFFNELGADGWRIMNPDNGNEIYLERQLAGS